MINNIYIIFENCDNIFKSKNSKNTIKKYTRKLLTNIDKDKYIDVLKNHIIDYNKFFNKRHRINFKYKNNSLTIFINIVTEKEINKNKLKNKYYNIQNYKNMNKQIENEINQDMKIFNKDTRINNNMINLYYNVKKNMPENNIPKPNEILDNKQLYIDKFKNYITIAESKDDFILKYNLLKNEYCSYMSFMTDIPVYISKELKDQYNRIK